MPNIIAFLALVGWVPIAVALFFAFRPAVAATIVLVGACVLLPAGYQIDLAGLPGIGRHVVGGLGVLLGYVLVVLPRQRPSPVGGWPKFLVAVHVLCVLLSALTNTDALHYGDIYLPGMTAYDSLGVMFRRLLGIGIPFLIGASIIKTDADLREVLRVIAIAGLAYLPIVMWEVRMSPQLHTQLYGYFPHSFLQHKRGGGYRPLGFTLHGLELALFMATATVAMFGLARASRGGPKHHRLTLGLCLFVGLVLCRSLGAIMLGILGIALLSLKRFPRLTVLALSCTIVIYPLLRATDMFPTEAIVKAAEAIDEERSSSLVFRFENEDILLAKARDRPVFGWGTWGRNRVYDAEANEDESVTDGYWVLEIGMFGLVGFLSLFGLLLVPLLLASRRFSAMQGQARMIVATVVVLVLIRVLYLIPNSASPPLTFFLAGTLVPFARLQRGARQAVRTE